MNGCIPSGPCTKATTATSATDKCYDSGVKTETLISYTTMTVTVVAKNATTSTCYSVEGTLTTPSFKDGSGAVVATGTVNIVSGEITVTCNGGQPVTLNAGCSYIADALNPLSSSCTDGTCAF